MERYNSYKDSNISWVGMIPVHWETFVFKRLIEYRRSGSWGNEPKTSEIDCACLRIADFEYEKFRFQKESGNTIRSYKWKELENRVLRQGDILIEKSGGGEKTPVGRAVLYDLNIDNAMYANFMEKIVPKNCLISEFLVYILSLMYSRRAIWTYVKYTTGIQNLDLTSMLSNERIPVPPIAEQKNIVSYLGSKTSKLDNYVADKEKEIELLQELKQKTIADAVTKGLNPNVKMKNSGISWVGMIPEHWEMRKLSQVSYEHFISNKTVHHQNLLSLSYGRIIRKDINKTEGLLPASFDTYQIVEDGNIVLRLTDLQNDQKSLRVGLAKEEGIVTSAYVCLGVYNSTIPDYLYNVLHSYDIKKLFYSMGGGIRQGLNWQGLKKVDVPLPPIEEQQIIVSYIKERCQKIDTLISELQAEIDFLREYKQRLIADVVTGQIKV